MSERVRAALRSIRDVQARLVAQAVEAFPPLERPFIAAGRQAARRSHLLGGLYWHSHEHLTQSLKRSDRRFRRVHVRGVPIDVDITDRTGRLHYFHDEPYEPAVTAAIAGALRPGDVFVDVGANIGFFTVFAARVVGPSGRVFAFEPHPGAREDLRALVARNDVAAVVEIVPVALADRDGEAALHLSDEFTSYSTLDPSASPMRASATFVESIAIRMTTFDRWLTDRPGVQDRIRCIKIDVEGTEAAAIAGMMGALGRLDARIICETSVGSAADRALLACGFARREIEPGPYGNHLYMRDASGVG